MLRTFILAIALATQPAAAQLFGARGEPLEPEKAFRISNSSASR